MNENIPESFEVLLYYLQTLVEAAGEAQKNEVESQKYMDMVEELAQNTIRFFGVLAILASALHKLNKTSPFVLTTGSENPEEYELILVNWIDAVKVFDSEKISEITSALAECSSEVMEGFIFLLMSFYLTLLED